MPLSIQCFIHCNASTFSLIGVDSPEASHLPISTVSPKLGDGDNDEGGTRESASRRRGRRRWIPASIEGGSEDDGEGVCIQNTMASCFDIGTFLTGGCKWRARVFADLVFEIELLSHSGCGAEPDGMRLGAVGVKGKGGCEFRLGQD